jgi:Zn-dependent M16 (insulinase) family peptidase
LNDFDASLQWLQTNKHKAESLEQAVLGVVSSLDKPSSPAGEAKQDFHSQLFGRNFDTRMAFRSQVLETTIEKLQEVAAKYLIPEQAHTAVLTSESIFESKRSWIEESTLQRMTLS